MKHMVLKIREYDENNLVVGESEVTIAEASIHDPEHPVMQVALKVLLRELDKPITPVAL